MHPLCISTIISARLLALQEHTSKVHLAFLALLAVGHVSPLLLIVKVARILSSFTIIDAMRNALNKPILAKVFASHAPRTANFALIQDVPSAFLQLSSIPTLHNVATLAHPKPTNLITNVFLAQQLAQLAVP